MRISTTALGFVTLVARLANAKDPCPPVPAADVQACHQLGQRNDRQLDKTGVVGMDSSSFYMFQESATGVVLLRLPIDGKPATTVSSDVGGSAPDDSFGDGRLIVGETQLYWWNVETGVFALPKSGGQVSTVYDATAKGEKIAGVVSDGRQIYWANSAQEIWQQPIGKGAPTRRLRRSNSVEHLIAADGKLLWIEHGTASTTLVALDTKTSKLHVVPLKDSVYDLAADDRFVYIATDDALKRIPLAGGRPEVLVKHGVERIVLGTSSLFYVPYEGNCGGGHLMKVSKAGGAPSEIEGCPSLRNFMMQDHRLFFVDPEGIGSVPE